LLPIIIEGVKTSQLQTAEVGSHPPVVPCELPDGIRLVYADDRGRQHTVDLDKVNLVDFGLAKPLRKASRVPGAAQLPGQVVVCDHEVTCPV
jgi:hypothetical protein